MAFRCSVLSLSVIVLAILLYLAIVTVVNPEQQLPAPFHIFPAATLNSRSIELELFEKYNAAAPVAGLIMGSSTSQRISPAVLQEITGKRFFNAAVFVGKPRDYLAQYRLLKARGARFNVLVIGIDTRSLRQEPEFLELEANWPMQTALDPAHTGRFFELLQWVRIYKDTFNAGYVDDTHSSILAYLHHDPPAMVFEPDGRIHYLGWDRDVAEHPDRSAAISACTDLNISWLSTPVAVAPAQRSALEQLIREAHADGVDLHLWLAPHHPRFFARLAESPGAAENLTRIRAYLDSLRDRFGISVFDLSDESSFGGDPGDWYDCVHVRDANARLIAITVMGNASDLSAQ
jgi:hypothetical protein